MKTIDTSQCPTHRVNNYTRLIHQGATNGLTQGDTVLLLTNKATFKRATVTDVAETKSVLELA